MDELKTLVEQLAASSEALVVETKEIRTEVTTTQSGLKSTQKLLIKAVAMLAGVVLVLSVLAYVANRNANNIEELQDASHRSQCGFYALILESTNPDLNRDGEVSAKEQKAYAMRADRNRDGHVSKSERRIYDDQMARFVQQYEDLHCSDVDISGAEKEEAWPAARMAIR